VFVSDTLFIRKAASEDLASVLELYRHLHPEDPAKLEPADLLRVWLDMLAQPGLSVFVGELGLRVVSSCTLVVIPNLTRGLRSYGLIENVVTHGDFRRRGFGQMLLRHAVDFAWAEGCYKVMLLTGRKEETVLRFYRSAGFRDDKKIAFLALSPATSSRPDSLG
jgi:GNAT superfamily N-acetyltransferase